jgi:uncharacterized repeat protein (TIGR01451 family)
VLVFFSRLDSCTYSDESMRNRMFQSWIFDAGATRVDVELPSPGGCGVRNGPITFSFAAGVSAHVDPCVDLTVSEEAAEIVGADERFSYNLTVANDGPGIAREITLTDRRPPGSSYVSAEGMPCTEAAGVLTCTADELEADEALEVELVVEAPDEVGTIVNEAAVASPSPDLDPSNDSVSLETQVGTGADVILATYDVPAEPGEPVEPVRFWLPVWNDGPQSAADVVVDDTLPEGAAFVSATPSAGSCGRRPAVNSTARSERSARLSLSRSRSSSAGSRAVCSRTGPKLARRLRLISTRLVTRTSRRLSSAVRRWPTWPYTWTPPASALIGARHPRRRNELLACGRNGHLRNRGSRSRRLEDRPDHPPGRSRRSGPQHRRGRGGEWPRRPRAA